MKRVLLTVAAALIAAASAAGPARARCVPAARDSLCILFTSDSPGLLVQLRRGALLSSTVPVTLCSLEPGAAYKLAVRGHGYELRRGVLEIDGSGIPSVKGNRMGTFARNIVPGWGSIAAERKVAGLTDLGGVIAGGVLFWYEEMEYRHLENRLTVLESQLENAYYIEDRQKIRIAANKASRELNVQNKHRTRILACTGYIYAFQLIDPWLVGNPPRSAVGADGSVRLAGSGMSTVKAAILSLLRPGRGQFYQGKRTRGGIFSAASTAAAFVSLEYLNRYDKAVDLYDLQIEYFNAAGTVDEKEAVSRRIDTYWSDVEKTRRWRNISFGILAGVWAAGVIDTFIPGREDAPASDLTLDAGPAHISLVYRF
jgi:hypothetical protein